MTGYLEEEPGVKSMTRLLAAVFAAFCGIIVLTICAVAVLLPEHALAIIGALAGALLPLSGAVWAALKVRTI